jgi:hypothetical protein
LDVIRALRIDRSTLDIIAATGQLGSYVSRHCERWWQRTAWRYPLQRSFPAWDLVAALDALELLEDVRFDGAAYMVTDFDAARALRTFIELLRGEPGGAHGP